MPSFIETIMERHRAYRAVEDAGALAIRNEASRTMTRAGQLLQGRLSQMDQADGRLLDSAMNHRRLKGIKNDMSVLMKRDFTKTTDKLASLREGGWTKAHHDFLFAAEGLPTGMASSMAASFEQSFPEAATAAWQRPCLGIRPDAAFDGVVAGTPENVQRVLSRAVLTGEALTDTAKQLQESLGLSTAAAERVARTNLNAIYNDAHMNILQQNSDIFVGYRWEAALDDRTTLICYHLHGKFFALGDMPPGPPAHWNCRSILIGVFGNGDLQKQMDDEMKRVRSYNAEGHRSDSFVRAGSGPYTWLRDQPQFVADQIAGSKVKGEFLKSGMGTVEDILWPNLTTRSDKEFLERIWGMYASRNAKVRSFCLKHGVSSGPSRKALQAVDRALAKLQPFTQPAPMPKPRPGGTGSPKPKPPKPKPVEKPPVQANQGSPDPVPEPTLAPEHKPSAPKPLKAKFKVPHKYDDLVLGERGLTKAEFRVLKPDFDKILAKHKESRDLVNSLAWRANGPTRPRPGSRKLVWREYEQRQFAREQVRDYSGKAPDIARARLVEYRAEQEMAAHGLDLELLQTSPQDFLQKMKEALTTLNKGSAQELKDAIVRNCERSGLRHTPGLRDRISRELSELLDMTNGNSFDPNEASYLKSIDWNTANRRAGANRLNNTIVGRATDPVDTWLHEFGHHMEYRSNTQRTWRGWDALEAERSARTAKRFGLVNNIDTESGYLGVHWDDYNGKRYTWGTTEFVSMNVQSLFNKSWWGLMAVQEPRAVRMLWAQLRGLFR